MKSKISLIATAAACLFLALAAYFWATGMMDSLFSFRSPVKDSPLPAGARVGEPITRRVVFILIDALRVDTASKADVMPTLARLRSAGASATMHSQFPSYSEAGYSTLMTGAWPYLNDGPAMNLDYADIPTWTQDNLFTAAARAGLKNAVSGYYWFEKLIPQENVAASFYTPGEDALADRAVVDAALPWLEDPAAYQLVLVHLDQVDYAGHHEGGASSQAWEDAAIRADANVAEIISRLDLEKDTVVVLSDHGQIDRGGHGGHDAVVLKEPFILAGAGVRPGVYADIQMVDVAPTLAALMGINLPASAQGAAQIEMLDLPEVSRAALVESTAQQQRALAARYAEAINQPAPVVPVESTNPDEIAAGWQMALEKARSTRLAGERWPRMAAALVFLGIAGWALCRWWKQAALWCVAAVAAYIAAFLLRYAVLDRMTFSFSSVAGATDLVIYNASTAAAALLAAWLVFLFGTRLIHHSPERAAEKTLRLALTIDFVLGVFVLAHTVLNGPLVTWTIPEPASFFLGLLALLQILFVSLFGLLFAGIAAAAARIFARRSTVRG